MSTHGGVLDSMVTEPCLHSADSERSIAKDFRQLYSDVTQRIFDRFDDDTVVHPGHGAPTTLGAERPHLKEWEERGW